MLANALISLKPNLEIGKDFYIQDDSNGKGLYVVWLCNDVQPTNQEIQAEIKRLEALEISTQYQRDRAAEYPPYVDYLDGVVKGDQVQIDKYIADCNAIKNKYPKI